MVWRVRQVCDKTSCRITKSWLYQCANRQRFERIAELLFASDQKMKVMWAIDHEQEDQRVLITKGVPDVPLQRCTQVALAMSTTNTRHKATPT
ncbi:hypothetical protein [Diaphorobacter nitroreducens]|uniref:hypothetical protein n=1 Tax=Diaphorobacter nitroreducens TaxID=164759 RepID=UPI0028990F9B|nr:hypothetical protein [Diaphorobacter nitroreducens]